MAKIYERYCVKLKWLALTNLHKVLRALPFILSLGVNISIYTVNLYTLYEILTETNIKPNHII